MQEAPANPALERHPLVTQARQIALESATLEQLAERTREIDSASFAASPRTIPGRYGTNCTSTHPIMVLGKSPAATEVERGMPFQGPAGQVLRKAFIQAGQDIESFYQGHATAWRPRKENTPTPTQLAISRPLLAKEIELVAPRKIIVLGAKAVDALFGHHGQMTDNEEANVEWRGIPITILRNHGFIMRNPRLLDNYAEQIARAGY